VISSELAQQLKAAGLEWQPAERDFFMMPEHNLEDQIFVVSALPALVQNFHSEMSITFHGSIEWALDYVVLSEATWMPNETQLRTLLAGAIGDDAPLRLDRLQARYRVQFGFEADMLEFEAIDAENAYAQALLHVLSVRTREA
jgi:hypothetical protein